MQNFQGCTLAKPDSVKQYIDDRLPAICDTGEMMALSQLQKIVSIYHERIIVIISITNYNI